MDWPLVQLRELSGIVMDNFYCRLPGVQTQPFGKAPNSERRIHRDRPAIRLSADRCLKQLVTITTKMMDGRRLLLRNQATRKWNVTRVKPLKGKPSSSQIDRREKPAFESGIE